jgi:hypothetical protein
MADEEKILDVKVTVPQQIRDVDILQLRREPVKVPAIVAKTGAVSDLAAAIAAIK